VSDRVRVFPISFIRFNVNKGGETQQFGAVHSALDGSSGSVANTSRYAPPSRPLSKARISAPSSTVGPRPRL
jgi:hypothetical protein